MRTETRTDRYRRKLNDSQLLPVEVTTVNFRCEENIAYLIRAAACFGASAVNVIGACPPSGLLRELSGTTSDLIHIRCFSSPSDFLRFARDSGRRIVCAELTEDALSLHDYRFDTSVTTCIVIGHEKLGVPADILHHGQVVQIPMPGFGYSLNAAQSGNIMLYEYAKQFAARN
jgi:tRNA G18 (ribose-2'-O)-methylase SpoU